MRCPRCSVEIPPGLNTCPNCGAAMNLDQIIAATGLDRALILPVDEALLEDAHVHAAKQLAFGFLDGGLVSVETLALEIE